MTTREEATKMRKKLVRAEIGVDLVLLSNL